MKFAINRPDTRGKGGVINWSKNKQEAEIKLRGNGLCFWPWGFSSGCGIGSGSRSVLPP